MTKLICLGCLPRSGSTLLINILGQNPDFITSASSPLSAIIAAMAIGMYESDVGRADMNQTKMKQRIYSAQRAAINGYIHTPNKEWYIDKGRSWIDFYSLLEKLSSFDEEIKIIAPIRDLRGVICSMEKLWRTNPLFAAVYGGKNNTTLRKRIRNWIDGEPVGMSMLRLDDACVRKIDKHFHFVRYEDLTNNPFETIFKIYTYLGIKRFDHDLDNIKRLTDEHDAVYGIYGNHAIREGSVIFRDRMEEHAEWVEILGEGIVKELKDTNKWYFDKFYPEIIC